MASFHHAGATRPQLQRLSCCRGVAAYVVRVVLGVAYWLPRHQLISALQREPLLRVARYPHFRGRRPRITQPVRATDPANDKCRRPVSHEPRLLRLTVRRANRCYTDSLPTLTLGRCRGYSTESYEATISRT